MNMPVMLRVERLAGGDRLQGAILLVLYTDAKAKDGKACIGGCWRSLPGAKGLGSAKGDPLSSAIPTTNPMNC